MVDAKPRSAKGVQAAGNISSSQATTVSAPPFTLRSCDVEEFVIGDSARDVILSGTGLDTDGLKAIFSPPQDDDLVTIEQPGPDKIDEEEFHITVQVKNARPGHRNIAVTTNPEAQDSTNTFVLPSSVSFVITPS